jgi:glycosyltransferase involved in cell wall biosynthesis
MPSICDSKKKSNWTDSVLSIMTKISVITVCFNESKEKIKYTFDSILNQNYSPLEFIVIDGGSGKKTLQSLQEWATNIDQFLSEPDKGIFDAMNKGLKLARGEWICFMNVGDAFYNNESLSNMMQQDHNKADILYGDVFKADFGFIKSPRKLSNYVFYDSGICHQAMITRKSVFENIGGFDLSTNLYGDADWVMRAFGFGVKYKHIPEVMCFYAGGGVSSDQTVLSQERRNYLKKYFTTNQRILFRIASLSWRIASRIRRFDMTMPHYIKWRFDRFLA